MPRPDGTSDRTPAGATADAVVDFEAVFEGAPDAYLLLAADPPHFTMIAANEARLKATMMRREDVVGHPLFEVFPDNPADPEATGVRNLRASLEEVIRTGRPHRMPLQKYDIRTPDGDFEERYWDPLNAPVFDDDGTLIAIIHRVQDVTDQLALRDSEQRYRLLADMIPQYIWTTDEKGYHRYFSRRWYELTGTTHGETEGDRWLRFIHPDDKERTLARWQHSLDTGEPYSIEYRFRDRTGEYHWFWGQAMPLRDDSGSITRWFGTLTDITERKRNDEERERLHEREKEARAVAEKRREELERVTESRTRLMRGFTHDVKNPLGAADGYAQLLEDGILGELTAKQIESIGRIRRSIQTSLRLINDLMELARAESGRIEIDSAPTDVAELTREAVEDFRAQATAAGLGLEVHADGMLITITDATRVRQILSNLLSNAVKYTDSGRVTVSVGMKSKDSRSECVAIRVNDTGPGIAADKQETIFQEFTRLDPAAEHGAGVGLAISRRIARHLGGDITVESETGRGSTFTLWLPPPR